MTREEYLIGIIKKQRAALQKAKEVAHSTRWNSVQSGQLTGIEGSWDTHMIKYFRDTYGMIEDALEASINYSY